MGFSLLINNLTIDSIRQALIPIRQIKVMQYPQAISFDDHFSGIA